MPERAEGSVAPQQNDPRPNITSPDSFPAPFAARLDRFGLRGVADFLLDVGRPFGWLGAQLVLIAQPTLALFGARQASADLAAWLEHLDEGTRDSTTARTAKNNASVSLSALVQNVTRRNRKP